ncbi:hypothetical protein MUK42_10636 [Musa troglodytarum]|uniref:Alpha-1,4 glucan phosphorylase n=1 Tax=Musa troglodytarum TaxID=320322 RepID=A0A9E7FNG4_9LILI|nr:hypothetical protein MUK42_10636 [Musa troglodytarum]
MAYTNHTVLPEALEKWSLELMQKLLPRHVEIIEMIDDELWPEKFQNKTNGVTPRWIKFCNPELSSILTKWIGTDDWVLNTEKLKNLESFQIFGAYLYIHPYPSICYWNTFFVLPVQNCTITDAMILVSNGALVVVNHPTFADNEDLHLEWRAAKKSNKMKVVSLIRQRTGYIVSPDSMFDIQVKRIHEYKRQLLNILGIVYRYKKMKEMTAEDRISSFVPRVVFVPDYNVSVAEMLIPASELSQHISTAGMEASGTSNMKFSMNGCILIGTLDGANVEIREEVGEDNFFLFGARAHEIVDLRKERAEGKFVPDPRFEEVKKFIRSGVFGPCDYDELMGSLKGTKDLVQIIFLSARISPATSSANRRLTRHIKTKRQASITSIPFTLLSIHLDVLTNVRHPKLRWTKMSILNTAGSYKFSSDRTIHEYAKDIWDIKPLDLP